MTILLTAGPTQEAIDPVRYLSNHSSGKMGYALAHAFASEGYRVILISGPTPLDVPDGVDFIPVTSAREMAATVEYYLPKAEMAVFAAAVADYTPAEVLPQKRKKDGDEWTLRLVKTVDILGSARAWGFEGLLIGFAAETENVLENAREKLRRKGCDAVVANDVSVAGLGFGSDRNAVTVISREGEEIAFPAAEKHALAHELVAYFQKLYEKRTSDCG